MSSKKRVYDKISTPYKRARVTVAPAVKAYVKGCMKRLIEKKAVALDVTGLTSSTAGAFYNLGLSSINEGSSGDNRDGDIIHITKLTFNLFVQASTPSFFRCIILCDKQANGAYPNVNEVLQAASYNSTYNTKFTVQAGGSRFNILYDRILSITSVESTSGAFAANAMIRKVFTKAVQKPIHYENTGNGIDDITSNNICMLIIASNATCGFLYSSQFNFVDN